MSVNTIMLAKGKASEKVQEAVNALAVKRGVGYIRTLLKVARFDDKAIKAVAKEAVKAVEADAKAKAKAKAAAKKEED